MLYDTSGGGSPFLSSRCVYNLTPSGLKRREGEAVAGGGCHSDHPRCCWKNRRSREAALAGPMHTSEHCCCCCCIATSTHTHMHTHDPPTTYLTRIRRPIIARTVNSHRRRPRQRTSHIKGKNTPSPSLLSFPFTPHRRPHILRLTPWRHTDQNNRIISALRSRTHI